MKVWQINCRDCKKDFQEPTRRGKPPGRCIECRQPQTESPSVATLAVSAQDRPSSPPSDRRIERLRRATAKAAIRDTENEISEDTDSKECSCCGEKFTPINARKKNCDDCTEGNSEASIRAKALANDAQRQAEEERGRTRAENLDRMLRSTGSHISQHRS